MNRQEIQQKTENLIRQTARESGLPDGDAIAEDIAGVMSSIRVDREELSHRMQQVLEGNPANPINALLGLLGLRVMSRKRASQELESLIGSREADETKVEAVEGSVFPFLRVDEEVVRKWADKLMGEIRAERETRKGETRKIREELSACRGDLERKDREIAQLKTDLESQRRAVAEQAQTLLSLPAPERARMTETLTEILDDLGLTVAWQEGETGPLESAMFTTLKCADPEKRAPKPCILSGDMVYLRGLRFIAAE